MGSRSDKFWAVLEHFRTSRWGVILYYSYLVGILIAALVGVAAITGNHSLALKANVAAKQAQMAAEVADRSLCFQKQANLRQLRGARQFLRDHPDGTVDFSKALILNAIHNDELDVAAFRDVDCHRFGRTGG